MDVQKTDSKTREHHVHPEIALTYGDNLSFLPKKSKERYLITYEHFIEWLKPNDVTNITEDIMISYMEHLSLTSKPPTLWTRYSMLKSTIYIKHNIDVSNYYRLRDILRKLQVGYRSKNTNVITPTNVFRFIKNAPDIDYLFKKVVLIFIVKGGCRRSQLKKLTIDNITDLDDKLEVKVPNKTFTIDGIYYKVVKKYMDLRPNGTKGFFLNYRHGKCTDQVAGINKFGNQAKIIAEFLQLEITDKTKNKNESQPKSQTNQTPGSCSKLYIHNNFEVSSQKSYENALEAIGKERMTDECQVFCNFVASEMRDISNPELRQKMKKEIQKTVLKFLEKDAQPSEKGCSDPDVHFSDDETDSENNDD